MKEHHHGNGHHRSSKNSSSLHAEHVNILDQLGNSLKDELKRGLNLIDTSVNQLAQAKWILVNIEKTLEESYTDCPACHEQKNIKHISAVPAKTKSCSSVSNHQTSISTKKEKETTPEDSGEFANSHATKPGPKSKTKVFESSPLPLPKPPSNYNREKALFEQKAVEKDKPLVKLHDISNIIKSRQHVNLNDYPKLQLQVQKHKKKQKLSVSNEEVSESESNAYSTTTHKKKKKRKLSLSNDEISDSESNYHPQKKRKHKPQISSKPMGKYKSKEIITSDDSFSEDEKKIESMKKKKHKHRHEKEKHHKPHSKSKVKEINGKSDFLKRMTLSFQNSDSKNTAKGTKPELSDHVEKRSSRATSSDRDHRDEKVRHMDRSPARKIKPSERKNKKIMRSENPERKSESPERKSETPYRKSETPERKSETRERMSETPERKSETPERNDDTLERKEEEPKEVFKPKEGGERKDIKAILLSKAKPDLIKQKLLEKFKQFRAAKQVVPEVKDSSETTELKAIGLEIAKDSKKDDSFENNILNNIQPPMALQDMIAQDELNEKKGVSSFSEVDEFIQSVLHNNNEAVSEKEIISLLKTNHLIDGKNRIKPETQEKFKQLFGQFQTVVVAHLQGGPDSTEKSGGGAESHNSDGPSNVEGAQTEPGNVISNNEQGNIVILNDSQLPSGELTIGNYFLIGREGYPLQLMKYVGGNNFEPLQMSNFTPEQMNVVKNSLV